MLHIKPKHSFTGLQSFNAFHVISGVMLTTDKHFTDFFQQSDDFVRNRSTRDAISLPVSVLGIPTADTHITGGLGTGMPKAR